MKPVLSRYVNISIAKSNTLIKGDYVIKAIASDGTVLDSKTVKLTTDQVVCLGADTCNMASLKSSSEEIDDSGSGDSENIDPTVNL